MGVVFSCFRRQKILLNLYRVKSKRQILVTNLWINRWLIRKFLEDQDFDIWAMEAVLRADIAMLKIDGAIEKPGFKLQLRMSMSEADGLSWAADFVAFKMKKVQPELG